MNTIKHSPIYVIFIVVCLYLFTWCQENLNNKRDSSPQGGFKTEQSGA